MPGVLANSSWVGLWRIEPAEGSESSQVLLVVSKEGERLTSVLYSESWFKHRVRSWEFSEDSVVLGTEVSGRAYEFRLSRNGERLSGSWELKHPQYRERRDVIGHRIAEVNHWDPHEGLRKLADSSRLVDLSGYLVRNAPLESFDQFQEYWDREVKTAFFRVFYSVLYRSGISNQQRQERLKKIWNTLRSESFRKLSSDLSEYRARILAELREKHPEFYFPIHFVSMPSAGTFDIRLEQIENEAFAFVATESLMETVSEDQLRHWLIRWQLKLPLFTFIPPDATSAFAIVTGEGIAAGWSVKMGFAENSAEALGVSSLGDLERGREALRRIRPNSDPEGVSKEDLLAVAADFGDRITTTYSVQEILALSARQWMELYVEYVSE